MTRLDANAPSPLPEFDRNDRQVFSLEQITDFLMLIHRMTRYDKSGEGANHLVAAWLATLNGNPDHAAKEIIRYTAFARTIGVEVDAWPPKPLVIDKGE